MQLSLQNVVPVYLEKDKVSSSEVWGKKITISAAQKVQIVASSGRGKTSLVHYIYGLRNDYTGEIFSDNKKLSVFTPDQIAETRAERISIIFQDLRLFPDHTAFQNIEIKRLLNPYHPVSKVREHAERLGIAQKLEQQCSKCSYGEQQRIAIIRALQQPFDLLIMDEPFSNLDEVNREKAMELIMEEVSIRNASVLLFDLKEIEYFKADSKLLL